MHRLHEMDGSRCHEWVVVDRFLIREEVEGSTTNQRREEEGNVDWSEMRAVWMSQSRA